MPIHFTGWAGLLEKSLESCEEFPLAKPKKMKSYELMIEDGRVLEVKSCRKETGSVWWSPFSLRKKIFICQSLVSAYG